MLVEKLLNHIKKFHKPLKKIKNSFLANKNNLHNVLFAVADCENLYFECVYAKNITFFFPKSLLLVAFDLFSLN